jgi:hypothetical protein
MRLIPITKGYSVKIDNEDFEKVNQYKWYPVFSGNNIYAATSLYLGGGTKNKKTKGLLMHRLIMDTSTGLQVDHIDRNGLNNQKTNLRNCTHAQNMANRGKNKNNVASKYKGISYIKYCSWKDKTYLRRKPWVAHMTIKGKFIPLGCYSTPEEAAKAYDKKSIELFGDFAWTNF